MKKQKQPKKQLQKGADGSPRVWLIPTPVGDCQPLDPAIVEVVNGLDVLVAESYQGARQFLQQYYQGDDHLPIIRCHHKTPRVEVQRLAEQIAEDQLVYGVVSDAGTPAVADTGSALVFALHRLGVSVQPLVGANSLILSLMTSGLNGQRFSFQGYLPRTEPARRERIMSLINLSYQQRSTQIWIETPYRSQVMLQAIGSVFQRAGSAIKEPNRLYFSLGCGWFTPQQWYLTRPLSYWRKDENLSQAGSRIDHQPVVFLLGYGGTS